MTAYEAETIINFNEQEAQAELYTASRRVAELLEKRGIKPFKVEKINGKTTGWFFSLPKHSILVKPENRIIRLGGRKVKENSINTRKQKRRQNLMATRVDPRIQPTECRTLMNITM